MPLNSGADVLEYILTKRQRKLEEVAESDSDWRSAVDSETAELDLNDAQSHIADSATYTAVWLQRHPPNRAKSVF